MQTQQTTEKKPWKMKLAISAAVFILLAVIFELVGKTSTGEKSSPTGNGPGERRAVPTPMEGSEAPLPLQIDDAVAKKLNSLGYSTNVAPIKVVGGEDNNK